MKVARRRRKSVLVNTALAAALLAGAGFAYAAVEDDGGKAPVSSRTRTSKVSKGTVMASVSASGSLSSPSDTGVSFTASGTVTKVAVKVGDKVTAGQVLAEIDATAAQEDVDEAQAALDLAEENLTKAQKGTTVTIAPTVGGGSSGSGAGTGTGGSGSGSGTTTGANASARSSAAPSASATTTATATATASATPSAASSPSASPLALTKATATPSPSTSTTVDAAQVAQAQSALVQAQNKLAEAKRVLDGCVLKAPTDGIVASVAGKVGDTASSGSSGSSSGSGAGSGGGSSAGASGGGSTSSSGSSASGFVVIANPSGMQIDVSFSEADAAKVKAGQPATVTMNVDSATKRNAKVVSVNPLPDSGATSGSVKYTATIALEGDVSTLRTGQTANVQVIVAQAGNALYVPSAAVTGTGATASVTVVADGAQQRRTVSVGVVVSGLAEGDEVVVGTVATGSSSSGTGTSRSTTGGSSGVVPGTLGGTSGGGAAGGGFPPGGAGGR
ncbi:MAG: HlyD family efflux transporter periplasmic adaptor subunit [Streptomycetaceae bacterium]|nr:HlyD family efflux transporter periplasmic adaptor subunit [Streptomycetaceae bacterium]